VFTAGFGAAKLLVCASGDIWVGRQIEISKSMKREGGREIEEGDGKV
jgi:hypothetical protein